MFKKAFLSTAWIKLSTCIHLILHGTDFVRLERPVPCSHMCVSLGSFPRKTHTGTCTQNVLPMFSGSLGAPVFSLRDLQKVHAPWVRTSLARGRDNSRVPQRESCFILE